MYDSSEHDMNIFLTIFAGLAANFIYTLYSKLIFRFCRISADIPLLLGYTFIHRIFSKRSVSTDKERMITGNVIHYLVGVIFSFAFIMPSYFDSALLTLNYTLLFGLAHSLIAVIAWYILLRTINEFIDFNIRDYLLVIFTGHFVYAFGLFFIFRIL